MSPLRVVYHMRRRYQRRLILLRRYGATPCCHLLLNAVLPPAEHAVMVKRLYTRNVMLPCRCARMPRAFLFARRRHAMRSAHLIITLRRRKREELFEQAR